ncbi:hypothetical protein [Rhodococcus coprophilus]|uniref:hypothetical protein n=1 Tax=Rhodococcus coprophilus TaxID=38310 RepID=UPI001160B854|nr:hypothetical protein [Rhodococcus coprophilus]MBM7460016.1 hypothetical protein [Rhodococcus coprophilus]
MTTTSRTRPRYEVADRIIPGSDVLDSQNTHRPRCPVLIPDRHCSPEDAPGPGLPALGDTGPR